MMVSITTAKTRLIHTLLVNCYITNTFYVVNDPCSEFHLKRLCHCSSTAFQNFVSNILFILLYAILSNSFPTAILNQLTSSIFYIC